MSQHGRVLRELVREFLAGRELFWEFHEAFLDAWTRLDRSALPALEREGWNEIYGWVLSSIPDPVSSEDGARGLVGEVELRARLRRHPQASAPR